MERLYAKETMGESKAKAELLIAFLLPFLFLHLRKWQLHLFQSHKTPHTSPVLEIEPMVLFTTGKHPTTGAIPLPLLWFYFFEMASFCLCPG
jgi:hypothetical protein